MSPRQIRFALIVAALALLALAMTLTLTALRDNIVFFKTPTELAAAPPSSGEHLRIGGLVKRDTLKRKGLEARFTLTDLQNDIAVRYRGALPDLFAEGQGAVAEGAFDESGIFTATTVLAKHDENYMPPEVAEALEKAAQ